MDSLLKDKNILIMGVANQRSIAWSIAKEMHRAGANLIFSYQDERYRDKVEKVIRSEIENPYLLPCDVAREEDITALFDKLEKDFGVLHGVVHSLAYAKKEELGDMYVNTSREGFRLAHDISAYSLVAVMRRAYPLMKEGGSVVTMTYQGSTRMVPNYNVMGVAKASLEASVRYLASDLGPRGIRVNAVSAGPVRTVSAKGIKDFNRILESVEERAPLRRAVTTEEIARTALFLCSDLSTGITGEIIFVDGGYHMVEA